MTHIANTVNRAIEDKIALPGAFQDPVAREPVPQRVKRPLGRPLLLAGAAIVALAAAGHLGLDYWTTGRFQESTDDAYIKADTTIIAPKVSGYLRDVLVADNQPVKAGQPLARIDDRDYAVAVARADADIAAAQADIANATGNLTEQEALIAQARAIVAVDQANLSFVQQDRDRYVSLARGGAGSVQSEQQAVAKLAMAQAALQRDSASVLAAERRTGVLRAQLAKAEAVLAHDRASRDQAAINLADTTIVAPVDGVVGNRSLRVGQHVQAGTQLMAVVPSDGLYVVANFKETQLTDVRPGQAVTVTVDMFPGAEVRGRVDSIAPASGQEFALLPPDNATGNFTKIVQRIPVKIALDVQEPLAGLLRPGMSVTPVVDTRAADVTMTQTSTRHAAAN